MCGIVACRTTDAAGPYLVRALGLLEYRGYDSAGVAIRTAGSATATLRTVTRVDSLGALVKEWSGQPLTGTGIGHTRWATHGAVTEANAHPHRDCTGRISVVHNGIIENADELRQQLVAAGHEFASDVDSEVVCHLVEDALAETDDLHAAVTSMLPRLAGSWALVVMDAATGRLIATADGSPLLVARSARGDFVASDAGAIAEWIDDYRVLHDGDVVELAESVSWMRGGIPTPPPPVIHSTWGGADLSLDHHADFMDKEIDEQPETAARILEHLVPGIADGSLWRSTGVVDFNRVAMIGCGTSLNAGGVIGMVFSRLGGVPFESLVASEAAGPALGSRTVVFAISQSGETADVLRAVDDVGSVSSLIALTNNPHSTLARRADSIVNCFAGREIGVAATKTFVAQVVTGVSYALSALVETGRLSSADALRQVEDMRRIPDLLAQAIAASRQSIPAVVDQVRDATGFLYLGRGSGVVYAAEGALKLKELSYRWAEHYPAGELKHGPLALVEAGTPVVVVDNGDRRLASNIAEVAARGANVIRIGGAGSTVPALGLSMQSPLPGGIESWGPLESVVPMQILARDLALALGRDVDKPRNLAKSVTVE
ncbi:glutamine--fructose-6-phosphate transaminase (isomerizing) [Marisediminicola senii]|uniref:glutamine--fructose-6-phosphate transaminase (isomerizing) n=1 Tax=Marisediminicola senii TaxID=2711233 RepID=UPI0013EE28C0|nr:glutamine--fructose-6-phosphate transaminase (isomerizing) [Marisediminicola senii]